MNNRDYEAGRFGRIADRIKKKSEPEKVILFGSRARGDCIYIHKIVKYVLKGDRQ